MQDLLYLGLAAAFFALTFALIPLFEKLRGASVSIAYALVGLVTLAIGIYLVWALFQPEDFE